MARLHLYASPRGPQTLILSFFGLGLVATAEETGSQGWMPLAS